VQFFRLERADGDSLVRRKTGQPDNPGDAGQGEAVQKFRPLNRRQHQSQVELRYYIGKGVANLAGILEKFQPEAVVPAQDLSLGQRGRQQPQLGRAAHQGQPSAQILRSHGLHSRPGQQDIA
jgi:hypothetical protein